MKPVEGAFGLLPHRIKGTFQTERAQFTLIIGAVLLLIIFKGPQPGMVGSVVRRYVEVTSASIIPNDTAQAADISSLMGSHAAIGQGGTEQDVLLPYTLKDDTIQAVNAVSTDYLDNYKVNKIAEYIVQPGDALSFIASDYGVSSESILWANKLSSPDNIKPGQVLRIPPVSGVIHVVKSGDTISAIAKTYSADGARILAFNELSESDALSPGMELIVPDGVISIVKSAAYIPKGSVKASFISSVTNVAKRFAYLPDLGDFFKIPTTGFDWGIVHDRNGVDIANSCGTPIYAAADGTAAIVDLSGWNGGFGKYIKLVHSNGTETLYAHLSKVLISEGASVTQAQEIGLMGTTGHSTGCHLHFEVHGARNPLAKY